MLSENKAPRQGDFIKLGALGKSLRTIAEEGAEGFYKGEIAQKIANYVQSEGGWITEEDLASHSSDWDEPINTTYRDVTVWECPPNGSGIAALEAMNIAEGFDIASMGPQSPDRYHYLIESLKLGYADSLQYVADPRVTNVPIKGLLSKSYADVRRKNISADQAISNVSYGKPAMATRNNEMWLSFGVMGGFQQPQGHLQVVSNMVDFNMNSQEALDALRFSVDVEETGIVRVEEDIDPKVVSELTKRGHEIEVISGYKRIMFGGAQTISRDPETGVLTAGSEPRKSGAAVGY